MDLAIDKAYTILEKKIAKNISSRASLAAQWQRIFLPTQETQV